MPVLNETRHPAEFILSEANGERSRGSGIFLDPANFAAGQIVKKSGANYVAITDATAADGIAIYGGTTTGAGSSVSVALLLRDAEVNGNCLTYFAGATQANKDALAALLAANHIIVRN
ncbi:head decoration protein [Bradyrhizobium sp. BRP23]|uniref:head decoration protein n=1 Tax=Bradyrhizobium sp. BRP23 TaxID=2793820 RepID=UPI001CD45826|nr:head decoration protein [Bradyrhizobium sp. BRP23]MCA1419485.1 head decoration protein [Bradyrhizobium sp. BRP23]